MKYLITTLLVISSSSVTNEKLPKKFLKPEYDDLKRCLKGTFSEKPHSLLATCYLGDFCRLQSSSCRHLVPVSDESNYPKWSWKQNNKSIIDPTGDHKSPSQHHKRIYADELSGDLIIGYVERNDQGIYTEHMSGSNAARVYREYHLTVLDDFYQRLPIYNSTSIGQPKLAKEWIRSRVVVWTEWSSSCECITKNLEYRYRLGTCLLFRTFDAEFSPLLQNYSKMNSLPCLSNVIPQNLKYRFFV